MALRWARYFAARFVTPWSCALRIRQPDFSSTCAAHDGCSWPRQNCNVWTPRKDDLMTRQTHAEESQRYSPLAENELCRNGLEIVMRRRVVQWSLFSASNSM